ncbi:hypothetical protein [Agrobacterium sp. CG674]
MTATDKPTDPTLRSLRIERTNAQAARDEADRLRVKTAKLAQLVSLEIELDKLLERLEAAERAKKDLVAISTDETITSEQLDVVTKNVTDALYGKDGPVSIGILVAAPAPFAQPPARFAA